MQKSYFCLTLLWVLAINAEANDLFKSRCQPIDNANGLLTCILSAHPDVQVQGAQLSQDEKEIELAGQRPNPDLGIEGVDNKVGGVSGEVALLHTFELGGKRKSRIKIAEAQVDLSKATLLKTQENVAIRSVLNIYRLRQIEDELDVVKENLNTFRKIRERYRRIGQLNPEQQISQAVFNLADEDNKLKENALVSERESILSEIRMVIGENVRITRNFLPKLKKDWPTISVQELRGSGVLEAQSELSLAMAESELARSEAWPDLSIGPKVEVDTGQNNETRVGLALSLPLPLYNTNNGGRAKTLLGVKKSELKRKWTQIELNRKVQFLLDDYKRSSTAVSKSASESQIGTKHRELHKLIDRGVVSAPLIIEMHREISEFYESLHGQELKAIENLWTLYALRGTLLKENLE